MCTGAEVAAITAAVGEATSSTVAAAKQKKQGGQTQGDRLAQPSGDLFPDPVDLTGLAMRGPAMPMPTINMPGMSNLDLIQQLFSGRM